MSLITHFLYLVIIFQFGGKPIESRSIFSDNFGELLSVLAINALNDFLNAIKSSFESKYLNDISTEKKGPWVLLPIAGIASFCDLITNILISV